LFFLCEILQEMQVEDTRDDRGRFKPGHSGNPAGKQPGTISLVAILRRKLEELYAETDKTVAERLIDEYIQDAMERKDGVAIRDMIDRTDGKPRQDHKVEGSFEVHFDKDDEQY